MLHCNTTLVKLESKALKNLKHSLNEKLTFQSDFIKLTLFSYGNFAKSQLVSFSQNYFCSDKRENSNKPDFTPVQIDLVLLKSMELSQFLLAKDGVQLSTTKQCLLCGLPLLSGRSCLASIILYYFTGQLLLLVFASVGHSTNDVGCVSSIRVYCLLLVISNSSSSPSLLLALKGDV